MFVAPDPNIQVFGPAGNNYGRDRLDNIRLFNMWKSITRREKIKKIFNVKEE